MTNLLPDPDQSAAPRVRLLPTILTLLATGCAVSQAVEVTFQHYRFTPTVTQSDAGVTPALTQTQLSEFVFYRRGETVDRSLITVTGGGSAPEGNEGASKLNDGDLQTKWFSAAFSPVVFSFAAPTSVDSYNFATANDSVDRTPRRWLLEGSNDNTNWVLIDNRNGADNARPNLLYTYRGIVFIGGGSPLPVITNTFGTPVTQINATGPILEALPSIVKNGSASALKWTVTGNTTDPTLTPPGGTVPATIASSPITPPSDGDTYYTLDASNASGHTSRSHKFRAVPGTTSTTRYIRFTGTALRGNGTLAQIGEIEFFNVGVKVPVQTVTNPGGDNGGNAAEAVGSINDGNYGTKWLNHNNRPVVFDFGSAQTFDSYQITTGNDGTDRDAVRWMLEASDDGTTWKTLEAVNNYPVPEERRTLTGKLPLSGTAAIWSGTTTGEWNTSSTDWTLSGTTTPAIAFRNNEPAFFDESSSARSVNITAPVAPSVIEVNNSTEPYSFSGSPITGLGGIVKRGSGELTLDSPNTFSGGVYVLGGKLTLNDARALGALDSMQRVEIGAGGTLATPVTHRSQRRLVIREDGGTIEVQDGATLTKTGTTDFMGTLHKTGSGTLRLEAYAGSRAPAATDLVIDEGTVDFATSYYANNPTPYAPASSVKIEVKENGRLLFSASSPLGGFHTWTTLSTEQILVNGGIFEVGTNLTYLPLGKTTTGQGRLTLQGGAVTGSGVFEPVEGNATDITTISVLASEFPSSITGTGDLAINPGPLLLITEAGSVLNVNRRIVGNYGFTKEGTGELVIGSANTYTGAAIPSWLTTPIGTEITAGTLTLANLAGSATGTSAVNIAAGATLRGSGTASGNVTVNGTITPGDEEFTPYATLALGNTTLNGPVKLDIDGTEADQIAVTGTLAIGGTATLEITGTPTAPSYTLVSHTGALTGSFAGFTPPAGYSLAYGANAISLVSNSADAYTVWAAGLSDPSPSADPDGDGIQNILEFVLNSNGATQSFGALPTATRNVQGDFIFTFVQNASSTYLNPVIEYTTALDGEWDTFAGANVQTNTPSAGLNTVTATLPASLAPDGKIFARLRVEIP